MSVAEQLDQFIQETKQDVFIEAEGKPSRMRNFFADYNRQHSPSINSKTDGIIVLGESADKWGLELRLYLHEMPDFIPTTKNTVYRNEYEYRINDVDVIKDLFDLGYRIGLNQGN